MKNKIYKALTWKSYDDFIELYNKYVGDCDDHKIYEMDEINNVLYTYDVYDILKMAQLGDFNIKHYYFTFNGRDYFNNERLVSFNDPFKEVDVYAMIDYIIDMEDDLGDYEIAKILEVYSE